MSWKEITKRSGAMVKRLVICLILLFLLFVAYLPNKDQKSGLWYANISLNANNSLEY